MDAELGMRCLEPLTRLPDAVLLGIVLRPANTASDTLLFRLVVPQYCLRLRASSQPQIFDLLGGVSGSKYALPAALGLVSPPIGRWHSA